MSSASRPAVPSPLAVDLFHPDPDTLYDLNTAARLADLPRRMLLVYCRAGLVQPLLLPPYGIMAFTEEAIFTARRIDRLRALHGLNLGLLKTMLDLLDEVQRLRDELRFLRSR